MELQSKLSHLAKMNIAVGLVRWPPGNGGRYCFGYDPGGRPANFEQTMSALLKKAKEAEKTPDTVNKVNPVNHVLQNPTPQNRHRSANNQSLKSRSDSA